MHDDDTGLALVTLATIFLLPCMVLTFIFGHYALWKEESQQVPNEYVVAVRDRGDTYYTTAYSNIAFPSTARQPLTIAQAGTGGHDRRTTFTMQSQVSVPTIQIHSIMAKAREEFVIVDPQCLVNIRVAYRDYYELVAESCEWVIDQNVGLVFLHMSRAIILDGRTPWKDHPWLSEVKINGKFFTDKDNLIGPQKLPPNMPTVY